jgi:hypothetical protein
MSNRPYPYYPSYDGKKTQPVTAKLVELCGKRWGMTSLGTYANRPMRNNAGLSVHATGFAADLKYKDEAQARVIWDWFLANSKALGLCFCRGFYPCHIGGYNRYIDYLHIQCLCYPWTSVIVFPLVRNYGIFQIS